MNSNEKQNGQVLAQVALMMVVLLGFLALAVDVSQVYLKRRQLQNAADAAALESARWICFVNENDQAGAISSAEAVARAQFSDPLGVVIDISFPHATLNFTTTAVVDQEIPSFVASIVGQDTFNPGARATAICGTADRSVGGIWPIAVNTETWDEVPCDVPFTVWRGGNATTDCTVCNCNQVKPDGRGGQPMCVPDPTVLDEMTNTGARLRIGPGQRDWLDLFDPSPPMPLPTCRYDSCGANATACYMSQPHPGPISICDQLKNESGQQFNNNIRDAVCDNAAVGLEVTIPLWNDNWGDVCPALNPVLGTCGDSQPYPIIGFGCIEVLGYSMRAYVPFLDTTQTDPCQENLDVIFARKLCDCASSQGSAGSGPPGTGVRAVSLIE